MGNEERVALRDEPGKRISDDELTVEETPAAGEVTRLVRMLSLSGPRVAFIIFLIALVTGGNALQVIGLNLWLRRFPDQTPGNFTTLAVSALLFGAVFVLLLVAYVAIQRPNLRFAMEWDGLVLLFGIGLMDTLESAASMYAASYTPEVLQALFRTLNPVFAAVFTKYLLRDRRRYCTRLVVASFALIVGGVIATSASHFVGYDYSEDASKVWWSVVFFFSVPPAVLMNVWQTQYMLDYTEEEITDAAQHVVVHSGVETPRTSGIMSGSSSSMRTVDSLPSSHKTSESPGDVQREGGLRATSPVRLSDQSPLLEEGVPVLRTDAGYVDAILPFSGDGFPQGDDTVVKLVMLSAGTMLQFAMIMLLLPMDALPWWGSSESVPATWGNFMEGLRCLVHCPGNYLCGIIFSSGFVFTYIGSAYLNQYSVTLCSMIGQLSSPFTALLLVIFPKLNREDDIPAYMSVIAIVMLSIGTILYAIWEHRTQEEKDLYELELKMYRRARRYKRHADRARTSSRHGHYDAAFTVEAEQQRFPVVAGVN